MSGNILNKAKNEYKEKENIQKQIQNNYDSKIDGKSLKSFDRIGKYLKGKSKYIDRGIVRAHLDFEPITRFISSNRDFVVISGKNPSTSLHLGHLALFRFLIEIQKLGATVYIPLTNDESYVDGKLDDFKEGRKIAYKSIAKDIIALGFDPDKTYIYVHTDYPDLYKISMFFGVSITNDQIKQIFGEDTAKTPSKLFYRGAVQMSSILMPQLREFGGPKNVLVPVSLDQHPYVLLTRDVAKKNKLIPPSEITIEFLLNLQNPLEKMSSSKPDTAIFLDDSHEVIKRKISKAYTGSVSSLNAHRKLGAIPEICPVFQILRFHHNDSDYVNHIYKEYKSGKLLAIELKRLVIEFVLNISNIQRKASDRIGNDYVNGLVLKRKISSI